MIGHKSMLGAVPSVWPHIQYRNCQEQQKKRVHVRVPRDGARMPSTEFFSRLIASC
jgi:hypothetical protein